MGPVAGGQWPVAMARLSTNPCLTFYRTYSSYGVESETSQEGERSVCVRKRRIMEDMPTNSLECVLETPLERRSVSFEQEQWMEIIPEIPEPSEEELAEEAKQKQWMHIQYAYLFLLFVACSQISMLEMKRDIHDPGGESIFEKLVKTSWDIHANPGPPPGTEDAQKKEHEGKNQLIVSDMDSDGCRKFGLTEEKIYYWEIAWCETEEKHFYVCQASLCTAQEHPHRKDPRRWSDWTSFRTHLAKYHGMFIKGFKAREQVSTVCRRFTDGDKKKCKECSESFFERRSLREHEKEHEKEDKKQKKRKPMTHSQKSSL